jgi:phosphatidylserine/phosphatidylglycerophosphate/cardiolipin synthase-like enzyme
MKLKFIFLIIIFLSSCTYSTNIINEPNGEIKVYFCPQDMCQEKIIELIDSSVDIKCAFYDLDLPELIDKLKQKNVYVILEDKNALEEFDTGYSYALMHNKFCVFDNSTVLTGSMNPTERGNYYNNNNLVIIESKTLAQNYLDEFDELDNDEYGTGQTVDNPIVMLGDTKVESYFCPEDNCKLRVINTLHTANESIYFMTFSFTDEDIGNLLWNKDYLGLNVKGILEKKQISDYSRYDDLKEFSIIDKNKYTFHHKVFIIDEKIVITGSYNPTKNANENNDENILIIHDKGIAKKFIDEFNKQYEFEISLPLEVSEIIINKVLYDVVGSDKGNEFIELKNIGNSNIDLGYYFLTDNKTNLRLNGTLDINQTITIVPKFSLKNSNGQLFLKKHHEIIDYVYWEGIWDLSADEGEVLVRKNTLIDRISWDKE